VRLLELVQELGVSPRRLGPRVQALEWWQRLLVRRERLALELVSQRWQERQSLLRSLEALLELVQRKLHSLRRLEQALQRDPDGPLAERPPQRSWR